MALTDLTRISTSGIATGSTIDAPILRKDVSFHGSQVGVTSALFDSSDDALEFNDNVKLKFGDGGDLKIYHDSDDSYIQESGNGNLILDTNGFAIRLTYNDSDTMLRAIRNQQVELYYDNGLKFQTTKHGAIVTGILTATSFSGPIVGNTNNSSGISTFYDLRVSNNLTVEGTTTTLDTNLIGVDRVNIGANSNTDTAIVGIQSGAADIVNLLDGTTEVLTVTDGGKVGIGTITPATILDLQGDITIRNGAEQNAIRTSSDGKLQFLRNGAVNNLVTLTIDDTDGKVAIGTDIANARLRVHNDSDDSAIIWVSGEDITTEYLSLGIQTGKAIFRGGGTGGTSTAIVFEHSNAGTEAEGMRLHSDGNVGIGTNIPTDKLDIQTGSSDEVTKFKVKTAGQLELTRNHADAPYIKTFMSSGNPAIHLGDSSGDRTVIHGHGNSYFNGGNFGVGTSSPSYKTVIQTSDTTAYSDSSISVNQFQLAISNSGANGVAGILLATEPSSGNGGHCGIRALSTGSGDSALTFSTRGSATSAERLRIDADGRILINNLGNATPGLSVNADDLVIGYGTQSDETGISMYSTSTSGIRFNDNSGTDGAIEYTHNDREMRFNAAGANRLIVGINTYNSPVFNMGVSSGDYNNHNKGDRASVKVGDYLSIESATGAGHNTRAGIGYNCYFHSSEDFYCGTNSPNSGDNRPAAYGMAYGNHYFYSDASDTAHSAQAQLTMSRVMEINRTGRVVITTPGNTADGTYFSTLTINNTGSSTWSRLRFDRNGSARWGLSLMTNDKFAITNLYTGGTAASPNDNCLVIQNNSNIGINQDKPQARLHVKSDDAPDAGANEGSVTGSTLCLEGGQRSTISGSNYLDTALLHLKGQITDSDTNSSGTHITSRIVFSGRRATGAQSYIEGRTEWTYNTQEASSALYFLTTASSSNGSGAPAEAMSIRANGNVDVKNVLTLGGGYAAAQKMSSDSNSRDYVVWRGNALGGNQSLNGDNRSPKPHDFKRGAGLSCFFSSVSGANSGGYTDAMHFSTYSDSSGGDPNLFMIKKGGNGVRVIRGAWDDSHDMDDTTYDNHTIYDLDYTVGSDLRLKEDINTIGNGYALSIVTQLRPVTYKWKDEYINSGYSRNEEENQFTEEESLTEGGPKRQVRKKLSSEDKVTNVGLIAQEVESVIPTVVHEGHVGLSGESGANYKNIDYDKIVPYLIGAIKELKSENDALKKRLDDAKL